MWKISSYERTFPQEYANKLLNPVRVLRQLKYRYEREVNKAHRSIIRKALEKDDDFVRHMVLCVSAIKKLPGNTPTTTTTASTTNSATSSSSSSISATTSSTTNPAATAPLVGGVIELTDGWYSIEAMLDMELSKQLSEGKIFVGLKLHLFHAQLSENNEGTTPLEMEPGQLKLKIHVNGTRRAKWYQRLGLNPFPSFAISLKSVKPGGGVIPCLDLRIERIYPKNFMMTYQVQSEGGPKREVRMTYTEPGYTKAVQQYDKFWEMLMEKTSAMIEKDMQREEQEEISEAMKNNPLTKKHLETLDGDTLALLYLGSRDLDGFSSSLSKDSRQMMMHALNVRQMRQGQEKSKELEKNLKTESSKITPFVRIKVSDYPLSCWNPGKRRYSILTIWEPDMDLISSFVEGTRLKIYNAAPAKSSRRNLDPPHSFSPDSGPDTLVPFNSCDVVTNSKSGLKHFDVKQCQNFTLHVDPRSNFFPRQVFSLDSLSKCKRGNELDVVATAIGATTRYIGKFYEVFFWLTFFLKTKMNLIPENKI